MTITLIAAVAENNALGKDNKMIWHLPDDFKHFKTRTSGHHIIMGRKTFESFPSPLPNRTSVIITRQADYKADGCIIAGSLDEALNACPQDEEVFVIGGGEIYNQSISRADKLDITRVHAEFPDADAYFPQIDESKWKLSEAIFHPKDEKHAYEMTFQVYLKA
ncbi:dihydrofolate reductase [Flavobacterium sp. DG1-102-2]|uniref:dihydrofolate reductase n=1 Tax=Flavobacterium sp. DG1-102-2 TaxID=3081663 RepID=UPI0029492647|nr:dihydrofolate reductase [Flavobacterium sp. DG1-102-2]MDV6168926.1 dihydrofolate reductase [Flavobacterium sp. DG1-102-2]